VSAFHNFAAALLRRLNPEDAHRLTIAALKAGLGPREIRPPDPILATNLAGLLLANPIGLAAGFDKNAEVPGPMLAAGFGFVECGTATPKSQAGNPRPRLFRLAADRAVINRLGFNNAGQEAFAAALARRPRTGVVGANIGANKDAADRIADYVAGVRRLAGLADYFTINISSPNTPGLRELQGKAALEDLLGAVSESRPSAPVFLKVAPDLSAADVTAITETAVRFALAGLIVSNTTIDRPAGLTDVRAGEAGGLSGAPLFGPSTRLLGDFHQAAAGRLVLIGTGGIGSGADAYGKIRAGASAVQLYSALVFHGPKLVGTIAEELAACLRADGFSSLAEAVGAR
jgi:dihydroorotate dehydrogenase